MRSNTKNVRFPVRECRPWHTTKQEETPLNHSFASHFDLKAKMLYVFKVLDTPFVKMGFTDSCPYRRIAVGFWSNVHPAECCGKLGWSNLHLLALFKGTKEHEEAVKRAFPPTAGEFWPEDSLGQLISTLESLTEACPLPERPAEPPQVERDVEQLPCCSGQVFQCFQCDKTFRRWRHLKQHRQSHANIKDSCGRCGLKVLKRNMKRHAGSCKA